MLLYVVCPGEVASVCVKGRVVKGAEAPLVSGGRSWKTEKDAAVRVWLAGGGRGLPAGGAPPGFPLRSSSSLGTLLGPLESLV